MWESLGEAYEKRGSLLAGLKAFLRAVELEPTNLFCRYKVASLQNVLGEEAQSLAAFEALLAEAPKYLPALQGLGQARFAHAQSLLGQGLIGSAVDSLAAALECVLRALAIAQGFACLWKLLGDVCVYTHHLPEDQRQRLDRFLTLEAGVAGPAPRTFPSLLGLGAFAFYTCTRLRPSGEAYGDVALCLWHQHRLSSLAAPSSDPATPPSPLLLAALTAGKHAVALSPENPLLWTTLGTVAAAAKVG